MTIADGGDALFGVDRQVLKDFLMLVRDRYTVANAANYYIEHEVGISGTTVGVTNIRDVLSHLVSLLGGQNGAKPLSLDDQKAQVNNAAEHIRRAVYEPYEIAAKERLVRLESVIVRYEKVVLKRGADYLGRNSHPDRKRIDERMRNIKQLMTAGREAKTTNVWNAEWEEADRGIWLGRKGIIITLILFAITLVATWYITKLFAP